MALPAELRNRIHAYVSATTKLSYTPRTGRQTHLPGNVKKGGLRHFWTNEGKPSAPGHILACKQMYLESIGLLYDNASFGFRTVRALDEWFVRVPLHLQELVEEVRGPESVQDWFG